MRKARFQAELFLGHNDVTAVIVPFDPREVWHVEPVALDERREGWLVHGSMNAAPFVGWIGLRWGRFFIILDADLRQRAGVAVGDPVDVAVAPATAPRTAARAMAKAAEQAKLTTAPGRSRGRRSRR